MSVSDAEVSTVTSADSIEALAILIVRGVAFPDVFTTFTNMVLSSSLTVDEK